MSLKSLKSGKTRQNCPLAVLALVLALTTMLATPSIIQAQVKVDINSGNPAFPFPQFLPYVHPNGDTLHNLGSRNPEGVVHAEMEKTIRDAYQIMMNRAVYHHAGVTLGGIKYIQFESEPYCSEGYGYAMIAAAMMADKTTFDGLWLYVHDYWMNRVTRHRDGGTNSPDYRYSVLPGVYGAFPEAGAMQNGDQNSAADGDYDIALGLMLAHAQWGDLMGINDSRGQPISYKNDFIKVLKGLSDTVAYRTSSTDLSYVSGTIGLDGYFKGGDSWQELTQWASNIQNVRSIGVPQITQSGGARPQYFDYMAPAYFRQFADYLKRENAVAYAWNIMQFERAEASSDWLMGKLLAQDPRNIPFAGNVALVSDTTFTFSHTGVAAEDMRAGWRTILNYVWHGNPQNSWNPAGHSVVRNRSNTHQRDAGQRYARFLWNRRQSPWNQACDEIIGAGQWWGPLALKMNYTITGEPTSTFLINWIHGAGSPSAVTSQNTNLMAEMYRQLEIEWDVETGGDRYITSKPVYFHGFYRLLGLNVLSGNHHAPLSMKRQANMKVYLDVDKTYAFEMDTITYTIDYRNYGAEDASSVRITNRLHSDMVYVSSTGDGSYNPASNTVTWDLGTVPGFKTSTGVAPTRGAVTLKVIVPHANLKRYENQVEITCSNGSGWVSNEYPNKISSVMKRNGFDIARRALRVDHSVYRDTVNPGMTAVYTINFENSAEAGWLNGGRPGVNFTYGHKGTPDNATDHTFMLRIFNDAHEAYIDYGNYRISYFMFDNSFTSVSVNGSNGWLAPTDIVEPRSMVDYMPRLLPEHHELITPGRGPIPGRNNAEGQWNQRLILQISDVKDPSRTDTNWATMATTTPHLITYYGDANRVHRGVEAPFKAVWRMHTNTYSNRNWGADWSFNPTAFTNTGSSNPEDWGYPVSPDFTDDPDPDNPGKPVTLVHRKYCETVTRPVIENILIEEWDGYTWRRIYGNGPVPGREVNNVVVRCTIPNGVTFLNFIEPFPFGIAPQRNGNVITWQIDKLLVEQSGKIQYRVSANEPSGTGNIRIPSRAWAEADKESPMFSTAMLVVTRDSLPPPPPAPTSMYKRSNKNSYAGKDTITYTIAYKQTHGYPAASTSRSQWTGTGGNNVSADGQTISFPNATNLQFTPSYGTNGSISGTVRPERYNEFYIFGRAGTGNNRVEIRYRWEWQGILVTINSNGTAFDIPSAFTFDEEIGTFNYKIVFQNDTLNLWIGDTTATLPSYSRTGVAVQPGFAGVRYVGDHGFAQITDWRTHFELAYNVTIRDTIPSVVSYVPGSAAGQINTGVHAPRALTGVLSGNALTWSVVSGDGVSNALGANDSVTVTWKATVTDTSKSYVIVNTAYTDLGGYPKDSIGVQLRTPFGTYVPPPDTGDVQPGDLWVRATPPSCIFTGTMLCTLTASPDAKIYYTFNGQDPDPSLRPLVTHRYMGQPLEFSTLTNLRAVAFDEYDSEQSGVVGRVYEPLRAVPAGSAFFFDDVGDGLAHGIKLALGSTHAQEPNLSVIESHINLIKLPDGMPAISSTVFVGDTVVFRFSRGVEPSEGARIVISEPRLPDARYANAHGYLAAADLPIVDGVAPIIKDAEYRPSLTKGNTSVVGDTLIITFSKYAALANTGGALTPFVFFYAGGTYELELTYKGHGGGNTVNFEVSGITGASPSRNPVEGDSVRIKIGGEVLNEGWYSQENPNNRAVRLRLEYPPLEYVIKAGPSPFRDNLRIWVTVEPLIPDVIEALNPQVRIYDKMGNVVAATGKNLSVSREDESAQYVITWNGNNTKGRRAAVGSYLLHIVVTSHDGGKRVIRRKVYLYR